MSSSPQRHLRRCARAGVRALWLVTWLALDAGSARAATMSSARSSSSPVVASATAASLDTRDDPCTVDTDGDGTVDCLDGCPTDPAKIAPGACGCGVAETDTDNDGTPDCLDGCPNDPNKTTAGACGCGVADTDTDADGTPDCNDGCPTDPNKIAPGACGCGVAETDSDNDGTPDCLDGCPNDPNKLAPGACGCGVADTDTDADGTPDCNDGCPTDPNKIAPGACGCGVAETDTDNDGTPDCLDGCPNDPNKLAPGVCGCGVADTDTDADGTPDCNDGCPTDPNKITPGACGCGVAETDSDNDGTPDCLDGCPNDPNKLAPGVCGCGVADTDTDADGTPDCSDGCPTDPNKIAPGACGCGVAETDSDNDGTPNCLDGCPNDPNKTTAGACGCGVADTDTDADGTPDCNDGCPTDPNKIAPGACGCGVAETDSDNDGTPDCLDGCPNDPNKTAAGACGCGVADTDSDADGRPDCNDGCPNDPNKTAPGTCGCGVADVDSDGDGTPDCNDGCPNDPQKLTPGACGCGARDDLVFHRDADGDGFGLSSDTLVACSQPPGYAVQGGDCDDGRASVNPSELEVCDNTLDDDCDGIVDTEANPIVAENALSGAPSSEWLVSGAGDASIQGFASPFSIDHGHSLELRVKTSSSSYHIDIYRIGYYDGRGARLVTTLEPLASLPQVQPECLSDASSGLVDCGNWSVSARWDIPASAVSGVYIARFVRDDPPFEGRASLAYFVVRADESCGGILFQTSDTTWQAYNTYGGASLYRDNRFGLPGNKARKVSYDRPFDTRSDAGGLGLRSFFFNAEYPLIRWLERNGYRVSYCSGLDVDQRANDLQRHAVFMTCGQDEYHSGAQRAAMEAARDAGVHLCFLSGNDGFWKTRWEPGLAEQAGPPRTLVCYKETLYGQRMDPEVGTWTGTWRDPRFAATTDGGRPENALSGTLFMVNGGAGSNTEIHVGAEFGRLRLWRDTDIANLQEGEEAVFTQDCLGHEWNEDLDNGFRPRGLVHFSTTRLTVGHTYMQDFGSLYGLGTGTHHLTLYKAPSGARVFSAGTIQWSWGLDAEHDRGPSIPDPRMQQATVNLLADMGQQPLSLDPALVLATATRDESAPNAWFVEPQEGARVGGAAPCVVRGAASDAGGGRVAGIEVSFDAGRSWHPALGRDNWRFTLPPGRAGVITLLCRGVDDSGNVQGTPARRTLRRERPLATEPAHLFDVDARPRLAATGVLVAREVGVRFRSEVSGRVLGLRFFKGPGNSNVHHGSLWDWNGVELAELAFGPETASGWQEAWFDVPVEIDSHHTYTASYHEPSGSTPGDDGYFDATLDVPPLHAPKDTPASPNGVVRTGRSGFPSESAHGMNFWIDVIFSADPPPALGAGR